MRPAAAALLALAAAAAAWAAWIGTPDFPLDDAYITLHNARALIAGRDPSYAVPALEGATSPLHLLLVAALGRLVDLRWAAAAVAWAAIAAYALGLGALARRLALTTGEGALLVLAGTLAGPVPYHLLNGLETGLALAAVAWTLALALGPPSRALALLAGLMPFVRPELGILATLVLFDQALRRRRGSGGSGGSGAATAGDLALALAAAAPFALWLWLATGAVLPHTAAAKRDFFAEAALPWADKLGAVAIALMRFALQTGPLAVGLIGLRATRAGRCGGLFALALLALYAAVLPGGLSHNAQRYLVVVAPLLAAGWAMALAAAQGRERRWLGLGLAATLAFAAVRLPAGLAAYGDDVAFTRRELAGLAAWVETTLPPQARLAVHDAGYLAFATSRPLIDVVGLKTPAARGPHAALTAPSAGRARGVALGRILAATGAEYLAVLAAWDGTFGLTAGLRAAGWTLAPLRGRGAYEVYRLTPPADGGEGTARIPPGAGAD